MKLWIWIVITLLFQELVSTNAILLEAFQEHYNIWIIHGIFLLGTGIGIVVGYWLGQWVQRTFHHNKVVSYIKKKAKRIEGFMGKNGIRLSLVFLSIIDFNFMDSFLSAWLDVSFWEIFIFLFIGNLLWYISQWVIILGINTYVHNVYEAFSILIGISVALTIIFKLISQNLLKKKTAA